MPEPKVNAPYHRPFPEQLAFFKAKLRLPTAKYDDILKAAHDRAFVVAGAMKADLLDDLQQSVTRSIEQGKSIDWFRKEFKAIVAKHGWTGWTGEDTPAGVAWRTRVIYQTNFTASYAAGRWAQLNDPDLLKLRPYWRYVHNDSVQHPRPLHLAWGQKPVVLRHDDPWWQTHFPPNGWGCRCRVTAVRASEYPGDPAPENGTWTKTDRHGQTHEIPKGIDYGWDYAPGANRTRLFQELIDDKLIRLPAPIGAAMWQALKPVVAMERQLQWWQTLDEWLADTYPRGKIAVVGALKPETVQWLTKHGKPQPLSAEIAIRDSLPKGVKQARHVAAQNALTLKEWRSLPALLDSPGAIYLDKASGKLIFIAEALGPAKVAVEFDTAKPKQADVNLIKSAFRVSDESISGAVKGGEWLVIEVSGHRVGVEPT